MGPAVQGGSFGWGGVSEGQDPADRKDVTMLSSGRMWAVPVARGDSPASPATNTPPPAARDPEMELPRATYCQRAGVVADPRLRTCGNAPVLLSVVTDISTQCWNVAHPWLLPSKPSVLLCALLRVSLLMLRHCRERRVSSSPKEAL